MLRYKTNSHVVNMWIFCLFIFTDYTKRSGCRSFRINSVKFKYLVLIYWVSMKSRVVIMTNTRLMLFLQVLHLSSRKKDSMVVQNVEEK